MAVVEQAPSTPAVASHRRLETAQKIAVYAVLFLWLAAVVVPTLWVVVNAFRSSQEFVTNPFGMPWVIAGTPESAGELPLAPADAAKANFTNAWVASHFKDYFVNSVLVTTVSLLGILAIGAMTAYALTRFRFRGSRLLFLYFISGMMIPAQLILLPLFFQFLMLSRWGSAVTAPLGYEFTLHDSLSGLITIYIAFSLPFTILVLSGFFKSLPGTLREAAIMDGCTEYGVFRHIMLPLAKPGLITAAIFNFLGIWNEYLFGLVFISSTAKKTLPLGLASLSIQSQYKVDHGLLFAGLVIVMAPTLLVYLALQRHLTKGITAGALKG